MKIFLDTGDKKIISKWLKTGIIDGVTTNPSHLSKMGGDPKKNVVEIARLLPHGEISVEITEKNPTDVYKQAKAIAKLAKNIIVKVPCHRNYYQVIDALVKDGIALNITLVFTVIQGLMMAKLGVYYISPFVGRWDDIDRDGSKLLYELRSMIDWYGFQTGILAASLRDIRHIHKAIMAGADVLTAPPEVLKKATDHLLTDRGIEKFDMDWKKLGIKKFP